MKRQSVLSSVTNDVTKGLIAYIREAKQLTPNVVYAYAALMLRDDEGLPIVPAAHHLVWLSLLCDENIKKLLIIAPPGSAKTTMVQAYLGCRIGMFPNQNYIIGSVTNDVAEKRALSLRNTIDTDMWKLTFPGVIKNETMKWEQMEWSVRSKTNHSAKLHPTVRAYGTGASITGSRADILIGDDLLDGGNTATQEQREKVEVWMERSFLTRRKPQGRTLLIGTAWDSNDFYAKIRKNMLGWVICHVPLLSEVPFTMSLSYPDNYSGVIIGQCDLQMPNIDTGQPETSVND